MDDPRRQRYEKWLPPDPHDRARTMHERTEQPLGGPCTYQYEANIMGQPVGRSPLGSYRGHNRTRIFWRMATTPHEDRDEGRCRKGSR